MAGVSGYKPGSVNRAFIIGIILNIVFTAAEFAAGIIFDSLALLSDAAHNLSDVGSLVIAMAAFRLSRVAPTKRFTFGFGKSTILASLINATILLVVTGGIITEAVQRLREPRPTEGVVIIAVAAAGIVINTLSAALFFRHRRSDLNLKGAFLHLAIDALVSLGVVISGLLIWFTGWLVIDPLISMAIAVIIIASTWSLFRESLRLTADAVPRGISHDAVLKAILSVPRVTDVHHVHIWALSTTVNSLTAHVVTGEGLSDGETAAIREEIKKTLSHLNIDHVTLEMETAGSECITRGC